MFGIQSANKEVVIGRVSLIGTTVTAVKVGSSNLAERKWLYIQNASNTNVFIHSRPTSGSSTAPTQNECARFGLKIKSGEKMALPVGPNVTIYASLQATATVKNGFLRIAEGA